MYSASMYRNSLKLITKLIKNEYFLYQYRLYVGKRMPILYKIMLFGIFPNFVNFVLSIKKCYFLSHTYVVCLSNCLCGKSK